MKNKYAMLAVFTLLMGGNSMAEIWINDFFGNVGSMSIPAYQFEEQEVADMPSWGASTFAFVGYSTDYSSLAMFGIDGGSTFFGSPNSLVVGEGTGVSGMMSVTGAGSAYSIDANSSLSAGGILGSGTGSVGVYEGGLIDVTTFTAGNRGTGYVTIENNNSVLDALQVIVGGSSGGVGEVIINDGGTLRVGNSGLTMNESGGAGTSTINLKDGGMLELYGEYADLSSFLGSISGTAAINYWDGSSYVDITTGTEGVDYTLTQNAGFSTTLTQIPEPSSAALIGLVSLGAITVRRIFRM